MNVKLFTDQRDPLVEFTIEGKGKNKILIIPIEGTISDESSNDGFISNQPSIVQEFMSQLRLAEADNNIKTVLLKINSPGGTITASDLIYHEILEFKKRTNKKIVVAMMDVAASGGYYISLPADIIMAHPTTLTGSIGVIFWRPKFDGLMEKIGVDVEVDKSGELKDMGSPFRKTSEQEQQVFHKLTSDLGKRFIDLVKEHRKIDPANVKQISTAKVFLATDAKMLNLIDKIGYLQDAISEAKQIANIPSDSKVVIYRRVEFQNDTIYNTALMHSPGFSQPKIHIGFDPNLTKLKSGFYYLWLPGLTK